MSLLFPLLTTSYLYTFEKEAVIFYEGSLRRGVYRILKGKVKLYKQAANSENSIILHFIYPGEFFDLNAFFIQSKIQYYTAKAMDNEVEIELIPDVQLKDFMLSHKAYTNFMLEMLLKQEANIWDRYFYQRYANSYQRVYHCLQILAKERGVKTDEGTIIENISQKDLANYLGLYRQRISKAFIQLKKQSLIKYDRKKIVLLQ